MAKHFLTRRLLLAAQAVRAGSRVADVGCDHGKLGAYLVLSGISPFVTATDISEPSLEKARELFSSILPEGAAETVLCDGLDGVSPDNVDDVVIAGVGADTIAHIIGGAQWLKSHEKRLVIVPASHDERVRIWLYANGFCIISENPIFEGGHCYSVMAASYSGEATDVDDGFAFLGLVKGDSDDGRIYIREVRARAERVAALASERDKRRCAERVLEYIDKENALND